MNGAPNEPVAAAAAPAVAPSAKVMALARNTDDANRLLVAAGFAKPNAVNVMGLVAKLRKEKPADPASLVAAYVAGIPEKRKAAANARTAKKKSPSKKKSPATPKKKKTPTEKMTVLKAVRATALGEITAALKAAGVDAKARVPNAAHLVKLQKEDPAAAAAFLADVISRKGAVRSSEKKRAAATRAATAAKKATAKKPSSSSSSSSNSSKSGSSKTSKVKSVKRMLRALHVSEKEACDMLCPPKA